ncbi:helix-turn-helix domain-containing protein [Micromonospora cathayae]|uniref:Helix-turn-helix domain-containing protein n=1 Tax=Micromonospora cathayae TaxID=3028804 RepID=A0ABY7ZPF6_9ACTN|nr:helix-turn-helix domain-containing protein [Micromonospora sp. HUAS 3]WDZ83754.1 helix-turn-helix domain-containing protein [Micromonospora sp. HUAS 3]
MISPGRPDSPRDLPIGRRVAQLRARRGMSQQVFADRIGRSKSWVDKVERGVRTLDRLAMIETVAAALGVAPAVLLGRRVPRTPATGTPAAVERVREALADYDGPVGRDWPSSVAELDRQTRYAQTAYRHAHHAQVLRMLPGLLAAARHAGRPTPTADAWPVGPLLVRVYALTAGLLVKLGEPQLAWLAADRAFGTAGGHPRLTGYAAVPLAQAFRALNRGRLALGAATSAVRGLDPTPGRDASPEQLALAGTLLAEAAIAAATSGDPTTAHSLTDRAAHLAATHTDRQYHDDDGFGPIVVDLTRALVAARLGDHQTALDLHRDAAKGDAWQRLPAEHRAAHLIETARTCLDLGDPDAAGRALVAADRIAPAEVRLRPVAHSVLATVVRTGTTPADVACLAAAVGLTRQP